MKQKLKELWEYRYLLLVSVLIPLAVIGVIFGLSVGIRYLLIALGY